jgi:hypothetical protein
MKTTNYLILILLLFLYSCNSKNIEGSYKKIDGSGGVFQNEFIRISKIDNENYLVKAFDSNQNPEWVNRAKLTKSKKLIWSDASLPMEINFDGEDLNLLAGNGTFGSFRFRKIQDNNTQKQSTYKELDVLKPLLIDGDLINLPIKIISFNDVMKIKPNQYENEVRGGLECGWIANNGDVRIATNSSDGKTIEFLIIEVTNESKIKGLPFNLIFNESTLDDCKAIFGGYPVSESSYDSSVTFTTLQVKVKNKWLSLYFKDKNLYSLLMSSNQYDHN